MNPADLDEMTNSMDLSEATSMLEKLNKEVRSLKLDMQQTVRKSDNILPTVATKVAVNNDGLVVGSLPLSASDMPELPMTKIEGLSECLEKLKANKSSAPYKEIEPSTRTGYRITYDELGKVVDSVDMLTAEDIPNIPMGKVQGLGEALTMLSQISMVNHVEETPPPVITFPDITMELLPRELINQVNAITTTIPSLASRESLDSLRTELLGKLDINPSIVSGTYPVVEVDTKGLVVNGRALTKADLPSLEIVDIINLDSTLASKANQSDLIGLMNELSSFVTSISQYDLGNLKKVLDMKADKEITVPILTAIDDINRRLSTITTNPMLEQMVLELENLNSRVNSVEGLVVALQQVVSVLNQTA